jgi:hypothetical protein
MTQEHELRHRITQDRFAEQHKHKELKCVCAENEEMIQDGVVICVCDVLRSCWVMMWMGGHGRLCAVI